jgi:hypothetical protein
VPDLGELIDLGQQGGGKDIIGYLMCGMERLSNDALVLGKYAWVKK